MKTSEQMQELATNIQLAIQSVFPKSFVQSKYNTSISKNITVTFTLGNSKDEYRRGIIQNDDFFFMFHVYCLNDGVTLFCESDKAKSFYVKTTDDIYAYGTEKTGWKNFKTIYEEDVVKKMTDFFIKVNGIMVNKIETLTDHSKQLILEKNYV
nr:hypothetical protein [uncultured Flavobacterium sp.]